MDWRGVLWLQSEDVSKQGVRVDGVCDIGSHKKSQWTLTGVLDLRGRGLESTKTASNLGLSQQD